MPVTDAAGRMVKRVRARRSFRTVDRDPGMWVFGEWFGKRCNDNCLSMANYVAAECPDIRAYWIADKDCVGLDLLDSRVKQVEKDSEDALTILKKAGAVFVNERMDDLVKDGINYCSGAVIVNLWHGVPWKKICLDTYGKKKILARAGLKYIYRLQEFALYPTTSERCTRAMLSGFGMKKEQLMETGLPRNSAFYDAVKVAAAREKVLGMLRDTAGPGTKIITYMPTFRDKTSNEFDFRTIHDRDRLQRILTEEDGVIIQKSHIANQMRCDAFRGEGAERIVTLNDVSAQELLMATDLLITDYSSCFFDYLVLNRPIIHYLYDYEYYANSDRGLYFRKEHVVSGDAPAVEEELLTAMEENLKNPDKEKKLRLKRRKQYMTFEGPDTCRVIKERVDREIEARKSNRR